MPASQTQIKKTGRETEITEANWQQHPKIKAIREVVRSINLALKKGSYKISKREFEACPNQYFTGRRIARDSKGSAAWYEDYSEGADATWDFLYYYDPAGRLRFVFAVAREVSGTREHLRIYFDEAGKRLWKTDKILKGWGCAGCFSAYLDSDELLTLHGKKAFADDEGCKEINQGPDVEPAELD